MKKLLLAGFEAWGPYNSNPAADLAKDLDGEQFADIEVHGVTLPIDFATFRGALVDAVNRVHPDIAYGIGMDFKDAPALNVEVDARQLARYGDFQDAHGETGGEVFLDDIHSTLRVPHFDELRQLIGRLDLPIHLSFEAGEHMCETVLRDLIRTGSRRGFYPGFIHVPHTPDQLADSARFETHAHSMSIEQQRDLVQRYFSELGAVLDQA